MTSTEKQVGVLSCMLACLGMGRQRQPIRRGKLSNQVLERVVALL